mmetsp:Transcript_38051/g.105030  ORF Transcript_38051/g.105030 Transcript_38051/m.105030 type:complete len:300 (+) Transcript_38051:2703-3602(+)
MHPRGDQAGRDQVVPVHGVVRHPHLGRRLARVRRDHGLRADPLCRQGAAAGQGARRAERQVRGADGDGGARDASGDSPRDARVARGFDAFGAGVLSAPALAARSELRGLGGAPAQEHAGLPRALAGADVRQHALPGQLLGHRGTDALLPAPEQEADSRLQGAGRAGGAAAGRSQEEARRLRLRPQEERGARPPQGGALLHQGGRRRGRRPCRGLHARARRRASCGGGGRRLGRPAGAVVPARAAQAEAARRAVASCWRVRRRAAATWAPRLFVWCARHTAEGKGGARVGVHSSARGEDT